MLATPGSSGKIPLRLLEPRERPFRDAAVLPKLPPEANVPAGLRKRAFCRIHSGPRSAASTHRSPSRPRNCFAKQRLRRGKPLPKLLSKVSAVFFPYDLVPGATPNNPAGDPGDPTRKVSPRWPGQNCETDQDELGAFGPIWPPKKNLKLNNCINTQIAAPTTWPSTAEEIAACLENGPTPKLSPPPRRSRRGLRRGRQEARGPRSTSAGRASHATSVQPPFFLAD